MIDYILELGSVVPETRRNFWTAPLPNLPRRYTCKNWSCRPLPVTNPKSTLNMGNTYPRWVSEDRPTDVEGSRRFRKTVCRRPQKAHQSQVAGAARRYPFHLFVTLRGGSEGPCNSPREAINHSGTKSWYLSPCGAELNG